MSNTALESAVEVVQWIEENQGYWNTDALEIKESKLGGVGVFAKKDLDPVLKPLILLRVQKDSILSFQKSIIANLITEEGIEGALALIISFIYEQRAGESSPWYPFIKSIQYKDEKDQLILPPTLWTKKEKSLLQGSELDIMGALDDQENQDMYERACTFALNQNELSNGSIKIPWEFDIEGVDANEALLKYKTFIAISHAIASRDFEVDEHHQVGLVPGACLFNHSNKPTVRFESLFDVCVACGSADGCDHIIVDDEMSDHDHSEHDHDHSEHEQEEDDGEEHDEEDEEHDEEQGSDEGSDEESEEEEFDGPIEEFIELIEAATAQEKEDLKKEEEEDDDQDSDLELEEEIILLNDDKPVSPDDCCDIVLMKKVSKGEELFNTYGDFSNTVLLSKYGFVIPDNINDTVGLGIQFLRLFKQNKKLYSRQFDWWEKEGHVMMRDYLHSKKNIKDEEEDSCCDDGCGDSCGNSCCDDDEEEQEEIPDWTMDVAIGHSGEPTPITAAFLKLLTFNKIEINKFLKEPEKHLSILTTKSPLALKLFKQLVEQRLKEYNNEINYSKLLKSKNEREVFAAQLVLAERSIIKRALEHTSKKI